MLDALTLDQIRMFITVAEAGSFRAGAARLRRAQSAVSHAIANLEGQLDLSLFDRGTRRPTLTPAGVALLEDARAVLLKVDFMRARARGLGEGLELELSVIADTLFPLPVLARALKDVQAAHPSVRMRLSVEPLGGPLQALRDKRCHVAILAGEDFLDPRIETEALQPVTIVAVAAPSHPLAQRRRALSGADLADALQIVLEDPTPLSEGRDFGVLSPRTLRVGTQDAKRALIASGAGWGRLPEWMVERDLADKQLVRLAATALGPRGQAPAQTYLARRMDTALGTAAAALREALLGAAAAPARRRATRTTR